MAPGLAGSLAAAAPSVGQAAPSPVLGPDEDWLDHYRGLTLDRAFDEVAVRIRYEPYPGILRGARGTALAASGNSYDKSMLLAEILRTNGYEVRFVQGALAEPNLTAVVRGLFPPRIPTATLSADYSPYQPSLDPVLQTAARDHVWLEVNQGETWLPLDPSFPRARIGAAYGVAAERFSEPRADMFQRVDITAKVETGAGGVRELETVGGSVAEIGLRPISLVVEEIPQTAKEKESKAAPSGGGLFGDAFSGSPDAPGQTPGNQNTRKPIVGIRYLRRLLVKNDSRDLPSAISLVAQPETHVRREWLEIALTVPGMPMRTLERTLSEPDLTADDSSPAARHRRYGITVVPGQVAHAFVAAEIAQARSAMKLDDWRRVVTRIEKKPDNPSARSGALEDVAAIDQAAGAVTGYLLALAFAAESDRLTDQIAYPNGVAVVRALPRILITSIETRGGADGTSSTVSLDLRLDEVQGYTYPGFPARSARLFETARGMQESMLEGAVLSRWAGEKAPATTAALIEQAQAKGIPLLAVAPWTKDDLEGAKGLPQNARRLIEASLRARHHVVLPAAPVELAGRQQWGWWDIDPRSGAVVGVMESGQHQAIIEHEITTEIGLNDETGFYLGCVVGAVTTQILIAAKMLEYGEVTAELIAEVKEWIERGACNSLCLTKLEATVKGEANIGEDCLKKESLMIGEEEDIKPGAGLKLVNKFCDRYDDGFKCAGAIMLAGLKGERIGPGGKVEAGLTLPDCKEYKTKLGYGNQAAP